MKKADIDINIDINIKLGTFLPKRYEYCIFEDGSIEKHEVTEGGYCKTCAVREAQLLISGFKTNEESN